jgi:hypothetical protein
MNQKLNKLTKKELLNIISKMKKEELVNVISNQIGGENKNKNIIKETENAIRRYIIFDKDKVKENDERNSMANNSIYNKIYIKKKNN